MYCIIVKQEVKEGGREAYLEAILPNAKASVENEPGCLAFDVIEDRDAPNTFYLYEIYTSADALQEHKQMPHYIDSRPLIGEQVVTQSVIRANVIATNPERG